MNPTEVLNETGKVIDRAADFGPNAYLVVIAMVIAAIFAGAWFWWIYRPQQAAKLLIDKANADTNSMQAQTMASMAIVVKDIHDRVSSSDETSKLLRDRTGRMLRTHEIEFRILRKMAKGHPADVAEDLAALEAMLQSAAFDEKLAAEAR